MYMKNLVRVCIIFIRLCHFYRINSFLLVKKKMQKALKAIEAGNVENLKAAIANIENINEVLF